MDLPHFGSDKDVKLVRIETKKLTFILKGKPYHERYQGLKSYQNMDFHDLMEFNVSGKDIEDVRVFNVETEKLDRDPHSLRPIFFENGVYQLIVVPKLKEEIIFHHEHPSLREAVDHVQIGSQKVLMGNLNFQNEIGYTTLELYHESAQILSVMLEIYPVKIDYKDDYRVLLNEVNEEVYNLAYHFIRKTFLRARLKLEGEPSQGEFYRLVTEHYKQFIQAIKRIEKQPHFELHSQYPKVRGDQLRRQDARSLKYLRKNSQLFVPVTNGIKLNKNHYLPTQGLQRKKNLTYDTIENRYVKWMINRLIHKLTHLLEMIQVTESRWNRKPDSELTSKVQQMINQLEYKKNSRFWREIGELDRSVMSLVMQMAPGYRDAFQVYLIVSNGLMLQGSIYKVSMKDVAVLYEYWTFLKLGQILNRKYKMIDQNIVQINKNGLFFNLKSGQRVAQKFIHPITKEKIILTYQHAFRSLPTTSQIPDTVLKIEKKGKDYTFNYIFDAKYRIDYALDGSSYKNLYGNPGPMEEDINTMHRYRDALVANYNGSYERTSFGAYILFPWFDEELYLDHEFYKSIDKVNVGGLPFLPHATNLVEQIIERLIDKSPEEIQKKGILPRGLKEQWDSIIDDKVLVGLVKTNELYRKFIQEKFYWLTSDDLKKDWQKVKYIALYLKQGVGSINGIYLYGKINKMKVKESKVFFYVDYWMNLPNVIKPVGYGIANYITTMLSTLENSKELPELFMASKSEVILWRMLRRVSGRIKIDLDNTILDYAQQVKMYEIKNIKIKIDYSNSKIFFIKDKYKQSINIKLLKEKHIQVHKLLVKFLKK